LGGHQPLSISGFLTENRLIDPVSEGRDKGSEQAGLCASLIGKKEEKG